MVPFGTRSPWHYALVPCESCGQTLGMMEHSTSSTTTTMENFDQFLLAPLNGSCMSNAAPGGVELEANGAQQAGSSFLEARRFCFAIDCIERCIRLMDRDEQARKPEQFYFLEPVSQEQYNDYGRELTGRFDYDADNYTDCAICKRCFTFSCLEHPLYRALDRSITSKQPQDGVERAVRTLPPYLKIADSAIPSAGKGVFASTSLPTGLVFGPYEGLLREDKKRAASSYAWEVRVDDNRRLYIDGFDPNYSNWMRYVNSSRWEAEQNLIAFQYLGSIFYKVYKPIEPKGELLVYYGDGYKHDCVNKPWKERFSSGSRSQFVL